MKYMKYIANIFLKLFVSNLFLFCFFFFDVGFVLDDPLITHNYNNLQLMLGKIFKICTFYHDMSL